MPVVPASVCDNVKLRDFIAGQLPPEQRQNYQQQIRKSLEAPAETEQDSMVLERSDPRGGRGGHALIERLNWGLIIGVLLIVATIGFRLPSAPRRRWNRRSCSRC